MCRNNLRYDMSSVFRPFFFFFSSRRRHTRCSRDWSSDVCSSDLFDLLAQTQGLREFLDAARAALNKNPDDLNATARVFYYYQQQGKLDAAEQAITSLRLHKEANSAWTAQELYTCGRSEERRVGKECRS